MKKKRERLEVIYDILSTVNTKTKIGPTRLLQLSNLSPKMYRDYIDKLLSRGLLEEKKEGNRKIYSVTEKGYIFIERYRIFSHFIDEIGV